MKQKWTAASARLAARLPVFWLGVLMGVWMSMLLGLLPGTALALRVPRRAAHTHGAKSERRRRPARRAQARPETVARRTRGRSRGGRHQAKAAPALSRAQTELAQEMVLDAHAMGERLEPAERVALLTRLLYTMPPTVMAGEKRQWAEELFALARQLPGGNTAEPGEAGNDVGGIAVGGIGDKTESNLRSAAIATAAARLALYDPDRALELLDSLRSGGGNAEDARTMASRLLFGIYLQRHGAAGAETLLAHARKWGEHGGFPYEASEVPLARLNSRGGADGEASEEFFRQTLEVFARGQEGMYGVRAFAALLERAVSMGAISEESAEEAGRAVVAQLGGLSGSRAAAGAGTPAAQVASADPQLTAALAAAKELASSGEAAKDFASPPVLSEEEKRQVADALNDVHSSAPRAYAQGAKDWPGLFALQAQAGAAPPVATAAAEELKVDAGLQSSFAELAEALRERRGPDALHEAIARGLQRVNARYRSGKSAGPCGGGSEGSGNASLPAAGALAGSASPPAAAAGCTTPDAQSWALVSLAAYAAPMTIAAQLKSIEEPFWHAYFLAIAAQQVGEPTRVADPTARRVAGEEEAEPEE